MFYISSFITDFCLFWGILWYRALLVINWTVKIEYYCVFLHSNCRNKEHLENIDMNNEILATIAQGTLSGTEEEGMMTFYRIPYGTNTGRFREVGAAPTWEGTRDASKPGPVFPQNKSRLSSVLGNKPGELNQSEDAFHVNVWTPSLMCCDSLKMVILQAKKRRGPNTVGTRIWR